MRRTRLASALVLSAWLHAALTAIVLRVHRERRPVDEVAAVIAPGAGSPVAVAVVEVAPVEAAVSSSETPSVEAVIGDATRAAAHPSAPTAAENPDRFARPAAASSGGGPGVRDPSLTGRRDDEQMLAQAFNADAGYQIQRIRTGRERVSREDVRATPSPGPTADLASRRGPGHARRIPGGRTVGALDGAVASCERPGVDAGDSPEDDRSARAVARRAQGERRIGVDGEEAPGFARPALERGPAATDGGRRSDDVSDRTDAALVSSVMRPGRIELSHPGRVGPGDAGRGDGTLPAWGARGRGTEAAPAGHSGLPGGPDLALATYHRQYNQYLAEVTRRVYDALVFPRSLALRLEQGDVIVSYTIRRDGSIADLRVAKGSGFGEFDRSAVAAVREAAPFGPLPASLGPERRVTHPIQFSNPAVR